MYCGYSKTKGVTTVTEIEIVKTLLKSKKMTHALLADKLGMATPSGVSNRLQGKSMTVEVLVKMLDAMDCELVIRNKVGDKESYTVQNEGRE